MTRNILGLVLAGSVLAGGAFAQSTSVPAPAGGGSSYGYTPPAGTPVTPDNKGAIGAVPPVGQQIQAAKSVEKADPGRQPAALLRQADGALRQRKTAVANELLERAQTAVLNRTEGDAQANSGLASRIGEARSSVVAGKPADARKQIAAVLSSMPGGAGAAPAERRHR